MARSIALAILLLPAACASSQVVVREGAGWRETQASSAEAPTVVEVTTDDPQALAAIARTHPDPRLRAAAVEKLNDPEVLAEVAKGDADASVRGRAVSKIVDKNVLAAIARDEKDETIRAAAADRRDLLRWVPAKHPEYGAWSGAAPATWVRFKAEMKEGERVTASEFLRALVRATPEGVLLEQREAATRRALQGRLKDMLARTDTPAGRRVDDEDSQEVRGRRLKCRTVLYSGQWGGTIVRLKQWMSEDVPGGVVRIDVEESPEREPLRYLRATLVSWGE
jgi:hypothetical protein